MSEDIKMNRNKTYFILMQYIIEMLSATMKISEVTGIKSTSDIGTSWNAFKGTGIWSRSVINYKENTTGRNTLQCQQILGIKVISFFSIVLKCWVRRRKYQNVLESKALQALEPFELDWDMIWSKEKTSQTGRHWNVSDIKIKLNQLHSAQPLCHWNILHSSRFMKCIR